MGQLSEVLGPPFLILSKELQHLFFPIKALKQVWHNNYAAPRQLVRVFI